MLQELKKPSVSFYELATTEEVPDKLSLYPEGDQYSVDPTAREIVKQLEKLHWKLPGIKVEFWLSHEENPVPLSVSSIEGSNFKLLFAHRGYRKNPENRGAFTNLGVIDIPKKHLVLFDDFSGPKYLIYRGLSWHRDRKDFEEVNGHYFAYTGSISPDSLREYPDRLMPYLVPNGYANHGQKLMPWDQKFFMNRQVIAEINNWMNLNILKPLQNLTPVR